MALHSKDDVREDLLDECAAEAGRKEAELCRKAA